MSGWPGRRSRLKPASWSDRPCPMSRLPTRSSSARVPVYGGGSGVRKQKNVRGPPRWRDAPLTVPSVLVVKSFSGQLIAYGDIPASYFVQVHPPRCNSQSLECEGDAPEVQPRQDRSLRR